MKPKTSVRIWCPPNTHGNGRSLASNKPKITWHWSDYANTTYARNIVPASMWKYTALFYNNNGANGYLFYVGGDLMMRRGMLPIIMFPDGDLRIALHLVPFWILTIWGSVHIEETVVGWRYQLRMKTSLHYSRNFIGQRSTSHSHATQSFITPGEPKFPQLFCPCMVQLLARIISLRRVRGPNPGRSHGSADTLPLRHSANCYMYRMFNERGNEWVNGWMNE